MGYLLGKTSLEQLNGVHPDLVRIVKEAITRTPQDFGIISGGGLRSARQQRILYQRGASQLDGYSRKSKHQRQASGFGEAVDLVPYISGIGYRWEWSLIYPIAATIGIVSIEMDIALRWGGVWDRHMVQYVRRTSSILEVSDHVQQEVYRYTVRHPGPDFIDGPHYEIAR